MFTNPILILLITSLLTFTSQAQAVISPSPEPNQEVVQEEANTENPDLPPRDQEQTQESESEEYKIQIQQQTQETQDQAEQQRQQVKNRFVERIGLQLERRYEFYYQRLSKLADKLEALIANLEEQGNDLTEAKKQLGAAHTTLEQANATGLEAVDEFDQVDPENYQEQRNLALAARDVALEARNFFQESLSLLKDVVSLIRQEIQANPTQPASNN